MGLSTGLLLKIGGDVSGLRKELNKANGLTKSFTNHVGKIGGLIAGAFAAHKIFDFGKAVFDTTAQFQKFEAVLTNTLGSNSAAQAVLSEITEFAARTPFQVDELTGSFVKLANQGFIPATNEMRKLGDLAAAMGKTFDQLTEAIIDAQTGEFERLKEFGIRASKQGDQVIFTFKGVKTQVDFTNDSIRNYILSLGDLEGVQGGMEAQSKTLGGGLSNLKDAFEQLKLSIGEAAESGGFFSWILDKLSVGVKGLTNVIKGPEIEDYAKATRELIALRQQAATKGDIEEWIRLNDLIQQGTEKIREWHEAQMELKRLRENPPTPSRETDLSPNIQRTFKPVRAGHHLEAPGQSFLESFAETPMEPVDAMFDRLHETLTSRTDEIRLAGIQTALAFSEPLNMLLEQGLENAAVGFGEAIGDIMSGVGGIENIGAALLGGIGDMAVQLGKLAIGTGIAIEGIKKALETLNPAVAIAAGIALIALGRVVSNAAASFAQGGGSPGGSAGPGFRPSDLHEPQKVVVEGVIRGTDLALVLRKEERRRKAVG